MDIKNVYIGQKVVPHTKTSAGDGLKDSNLWMAEGGEEQGFMYIIRNERRYFVLAVNKDDIGGDYFNASDFEPYIESPPIAKRSPTQRIKSVHIGRKTTVILADGRIGTALCDKCDSFDPVKGVTLAYIRALGNNADDITITITSKDQLKADCMTLIHPSEYGYGYRGYIYNGVLQAVKLYRERTKKSTNASKAQIDAWIEEVAK